MTMCSSQISKDHYWTLNTERGQPCKRLRVATSSQYHIHRASPILAPIGPHPNRPNTNLSHHQSPSLERFLGTDDMEIEDGVDVITQGLRAHTRIQRLDLVARPPQHIAKQHRRKPRYALDEVHAQ